MKRPLLAVVLGAVLMGLAIPLALLGRAALATPDRVELTRTEDGVASRPGPFDRAAAWLLGAPPSDPFFALVSEYRAAASAESTFTDSATPVRLAALARKVGPTTEQAQAHLMVGTIFALPAGNGSMSFGRLRLMGGARLLRQAEEEFREAARLDERSEAAKYDLELVLKSQTAAFSALSGRRQTPTSRLPGRNRHQGQDTKHPRTKRRLRQGGVYGAGSGY